MAIVPEFVDLSLNPSAESNEMDSSLLSELLKSIKLTGYDGSLLSENQLSSALSEGPKNIEYTKLVNFIANELREICSLDEHVNTIASPEDSATFIMETGSFLKELSCPYERLVQGHVSDRLNTVEDRYLLIKYLTSELVAARILRENQPGRRLDLKLKESEQASDLRKILQILGYPQPPKNITMQLLLKKLTPSIQNLLAKAPKELIGTPIFNGTLSDAQWDTLEKINQDLHDEYSIRREMLLKRLDCTVQSFQWSDRTKGKDNAFERNYTEKRKLLTAESNVGIADLLAARSDVAIIEKTSNASVRKNTKSSINKVIIGAVPDRGGRTSEQAPPPPEMPPWQQRNAGPAGGGGRGGFGNANSNFSRGGGGSNFSRGGFSNNYSDSSYNRGGAGRGASNNFGSQGSFDSAGSYGDSSRGYSQSGGSDSYSQGRGYSSGNNSGYSGRGGDSYSRDNQGYSRDTNTGYSRDSNSGYSRDSNSGYSRDSSSGYSRDSNSGYSQDSNRTYSQGGYSKGYDSAGSYGNYSQDYQEPKRPKTYDQFQQNRTTYADQYVQESQHNMQYQSRDRDNRNRGRGGGRSNYNRGGGSYR